MGATSASMGRALGLVYLGGPTIAVVSLLLPHSQDTDETGIWVLCGVAYAMVPVLFGFYQRLPIWAFELIIAFAAALVTLLVWFDGEVASEYAFFYLWPTPFAFVFFTVRRALLQLAFSAAAYATVLALLADRHPDRAGSGSELTYWLLEVAALVAVGLLVRALARAVQAGAEERDRDRQRRALEINDSILQGLVVARTAREQGDEAGADAAVDETLERAREIVTGLLGDDVAPGDLRRDLPAGDGR